MVPLPIGRLASNVYAVRIETEDGRVGYAPLIVRPATLGTARQAVVMPTNTWQAYNHYDLDGDGWGDTWYAWRQPTRPARPTAPRPRYAAALASLRRGLPQVGALDAPLAPTSPRTTSRRSRRATSCDDYDLVVFPGHTEYVTEHAYDVVQRFRDLGGRLIFLSANNFFWKVEKRGNTIRRVKLWRELGRPEAALCGVQYKANDDGTVRSKARSTSSAPPMRPGSGKGQG